jgi:hypothetical protein
MFSGSAHMYQEMVCSKSQNRRLFSSQGEDHIDSAQESSGERGAARGGKPGGGTSRTSANRTRCSRGHQGLGEITPPRMCVYGGRVAYSRINISLGLSYEVYHDMRDCSSRVVRPDDE